MMDSLRSRVRVGGSQSIPIPFLAPRPSLHSTNRLSSRRPQQQYLNAISTASGRRQFTSNASKQQSNSRKPINSGPTSLNYSLGNKYSFETPHNGVAKRASYSTGASVTSKAIIYDVFEEVTGTWQFIIADPSTLKAVIIDPVLNYDRATQILTTKSADALLSMVKDNSYKVEMILETHAHADHLTAASYLQHRLIEEQGHRPSIGIGKRIRQVQERFGERYGIPAEEYEGVFDKLFDDDEKINIGNLSITALHLPGHTPDHLGYKVEDNVFCGDSLFHADIGTARCDFPGGSAKELFKSGRKLLDLSEDVKIWPGHDYPPEARAPTSWMTVQQHKKQNMHLKDGRTEAEFIALREERDEILAAPKLIHQSLQFNIRAGRLPKATGPAGFRLLHLPLKLDCKEW